VKCPIDQTDLQMTERQGIEIDYCPTCRGVWLDRGELDKIVERGASFERAAPAQPAAPVSGAAPYPRRSDWDDDDDDRDERRYDERSREGSYQGQYGSQPPRKKKRGFLGELFDFE